MQPRGGSPLRILLVEDNQINCELALRMLGRLGYSASVAHNGLEALEAVKQQRFDVILMDLMMPVLDGFETSRRIRAELPPAQQPRIIALTANAILGDREQCLRAGMDDYLSKPVSSQELLKALSGGRGGERAVAQGMPTTPLFFDPAAIRRLSDNLGSAAATMLPALINAFFNESGLMLDAITTALEAHDLITVHRLAHTLKSHGVTFGGPALEQASRALESAARSGDYDDALRRLPDVRVAYTRLCAALKTPHSATTE